MNRRDQLSEQIRETRTHARRGEPESFWKETGDSVHGNAAGELAGLRSAHPITDGENKIRRPKRSLPGFAQVPNLAAIDRQREEGVLIVFPHASDMGHARPMHLGWGWWTGRAGGRWRSFGRAHGCSEGLSEIGLPVPSSRIVANSKSMMQNLPSATR